jgi:3-deoxy-D-manno-octulosonic-acid transferase
MISLLIYRILFLLLLPVIIAFLFIRSKNNPAYRQRITERLGFFPKPIKYGGIVVHAASVGEVIALKSFINDLLSAYPHLPITITTFTPTGSAQVKKLFADKVQHGYLPLDVLPCSWLFLQRLKPKLMIFMETELWPNLIAQCHKKKVKLLLINGRLSEKSLRSYSKLKPLITPCLQRFDSILTQSNQNLSHFLQLGAPPENCINSGNLKFDISLNHQIETKRKELSQYLPKERNIWLVASTHKGDEAITLNAFKKLITKFPDLLLVIVPRHPERFSTIAELCVNQEFSVVKRSDNKVITHENIWLLDSLGELMAAFALSDIVTMGGSFSGDIGGHNPLEPALFKKPIIVGNDMSNFTEVMQQLHHDNALIQLNTPATTSNVDEQVNDLYQAVSNLLKSPAQQKVLGERAHKVILTNQGASKITLKYVKALQQSE